MVFQQLALWPHLTVAGNLAFGMKARRVPRADRRGRIAEALALVGLGGFEPRLPGSLSGGEQQRVALARALVGRPRLLLLDEPLSSVDAMLRDELLAEIRRLNLALGVTTLYVTHDRHEALALGRRIAVMERGRIVQLDSPERLHRAPVSRFVAALMGALNLFFARPEPGGRLVWLPDADPYQAPPPGAVLAAVRATELVIGTPEADGLRATVEASMFHGDTWLVALRAGRLDLQAAHDRALEPGTVVTVAVRGTPRVLA